MDTKNADVETTTAHQHIPGGGLHCGIFCSRDLRAVFARSSITHSVLGVLGIYDVLVEGLYQINSLLNKRLPFKASIPRRIGVQMVSGAVYALTLRFLLYEIGEPFLTVKLDSMFLAATWFLYILASVIVNSIFITRLFY